MRGFGSIDRPGPPHPPRYARRPLPCGERWSPRRRLVSIALTSIVAYSARSARLRRYAARRQGRARGVLLRAGRHRRAHRHLQAQRRRHRDQQLRRRRAHPAGDGRRRHRRRARLRPGPRLHRQGLAGEGHRRHGGAAAAVRAGGAQRRRGEDGRRPQGPQGRGLHRRLGDELDHQRGVAAAGLGLRRHRAGADRRRRQPDRGAQDQVGRRRHRQPGAGAQFRAARRGPRAAALRRAGQGLPHPRDLRDRQGDRRQARGAARLPQGLARDHRVHAQATRPRRSRSPRR